MKLSVRIKDAICVPGTEIGLVLCDESGAELPNQTKVTLTTGVDDLPRLIVEFCVDGDDVKLIKSA